MKQIIALAKKDLRLMPRNKAGMFFTFAWPIVLMVLFGFAFGGNATSGGAQPKMRIAVINADNSDASRKFLTGLEASFELTPMTMAEADAAVRLGRRAGYLVVTPGFGAASQRVLAGPSREVELGVDPGRQAEAGMIEGLLMKQAGAELLTRFTSRDGAGEAWQPLKITSNAVAYFTTIMVVEVILLTVAFGFGVRPSSMGMLALAGVSAAVCFVGVMMLIASLGKTEQTASGAGWAILMPLSMLGGAMVPQFVMPQWMQTAGMVSPIRWVILAIEGGIWRRFTLNEMLLPCAILVSVGIVCFIAGTRGLRET